MKAIFVILILVGTLHFLLISNKTYKVPGQSFLSEAQYKEFLKLPKNESKKVELIGSTHLYYFGIIPAVCRNLFYLAYAALAIGFLLLYPNREFPRLFVGACFFTWLTIGTSMTIYHYSLANRKAAIPLRKDIEEYQKLLDQPAIIYRNLTRQRDSLAQLLKTQQ